MNKSIPFLATVVAIIMSSCSNDREEAEDTPPPNICDSLNVTYSGTVSAIISTNCAISGCHVSGFAYGDYTSYAGVKAKVDQSGSNSFENRAIVQQNMPPAGPLTADEIDKLQCWLQDGAPNN